MPITESETVHTFAWEGPISVATAIVVLAVVAVVFACLLWRERHAVGSLRVVFFWILRLCAVTVVLWMLLEPTHLTRHVTSSPQSIAVLVDRSQSMGVVDPGGRNDAIRWTLAAQSPQPESNTESRGSSLAECDRAAFAMQMAVDRAVQAARSLELHRPLQVVRQHADSIVDALGRATMHLEQASAELRRYDTALAGRAERIRGQLQGPIRESWAECDRVLSRDQVLTPTDLTVRLTSLSSQLAGSQRRLSHLVRDAADRLQDVFPEKSFQPAVTMSRSQKVARALEPLEENALRKLEGNVRVKRVSFAEIPTPVPDGADWADVLEPTKPGDTQDRVSSSRRDQTEPAHSQIGSRNDDRKAGHVGPTTNITAALEHLTREADADSIKSVYLITDGSHNQPDTLSPQEVAASLDNVPVFVVPIGDDKPLRDLILHRVDAPTTVVEKDSIVIDAIVTGFSCRGEETLAVLKHNGQPIDQQTLEFDRERIDRRVSFRVSADKLGRHEFELSVQPVDDEASTRNNVASMQVEVIKDKMQLLLAHRISHWEFQFLEQLFPRDKRVEFDHLRFEPAIHATGAVRRSGALPSDVNGWARYDAVILGDVSPDQLNRRSQEALAEYVRDRGGNLVVVAGRDNMPQAFAQQILAKLLPVEPDNRRRAKDSTYFLELTREGRGHNALMIEETPEKSQKVWRNIYRQLPIHFLSTYSRPKPSARTLIEAIPRDVAIRSNRSGAEDVESAFLCWHNVGAGRVVFLAAPATYQLRFRRGDGYHHRFWGQLLRWVMAGELASGSDRLRIRTDKAKYVYGDHVQVSVRMSDKDGQPVPDAKFEVVARPTEGAETVVEMTSDRRVPGEYRGTVEGLTPGSYRLQPRGESIAQIIADSAEASVLINVSASQSIEMLNTQCDRALLKQIAVITGGQVIPPTAMSEVLELTELSPEVSERVERQPLWNRWRYLFIVFGCLAVEWVFRKQLGLA